MIILITCIEKRGDIIAQLLAERLELPLIYCKGLTGLEIEEQIQEQIRQSSSSILLTDQILGSKNRHILHIYLYSEESDSESENSSLIKAPVVRYDMGLEISELSNKACAETICQFIAIRRMQRLGRGRSLSS